MAESNLKQLFIFCIVIYNKTSKSEGQYCPAENETDGVEWPATSMRTLSHPICLDANKEFIYRTCSNGEWSPAPECTYIQFKTLPKCPEDFTDAGNICYRLSPKSAFPPKCPFVDLLPFNEYKSIVDDDNNIGPVWLPAKRDDLDFLRWTESSWLYKQEVTGYKVTNFLRNKNCVLYLNQTYTMTSCRERHYGVCAYKKLDKVDSDICDSDRCLRSDFVIKSSCFCEESLNKSKIRVNPRAEFIKPYQYSIYQKLTKRVCAIGLKKSPNGPYIWSQSLKQVDYAYWSSNVNFDETYTIAVATPSGWDLANDTVSCELLQKNIILPEPSLSLTFEENKNRFVLTIINRKSFQQVYSRILFFCFTDADPFNSIFIYPTHQILSVNSTSYAFKRINFPGNYWCEAFKYIDLSIIKTDNYFLGRIGYLEFVGIFQVHYGENIDFSNTNFTDFIKSGLFFILNKNSQIRESYDLRFMKILNLDEENRYMILNIHFSSTNLFSSPKKEEEEENVLGNLANIIKRTLRNLDYEQVVLINLLSTDFCQAHTDYLTWPKAPLGSFVSPEEFCFKSDGTPVTRVCSGDFINGAQWSYYEKCERFESSLLTNRLLNVSYSSSSDSIEQMYALSENYENLNSLDLYLVSKMYSEFLYIPDINAFAATINNILNMNGSILAEAQLKFMATDKLLHCIDRVPVDYDKSFEANLNNFVFISLPPQDFNGLAVVQNDDEFIVKKLPSTYTLEDVFQIDNLKSAIWLSHSLRADMAAVERITFSVYFNDGLFQQASSVKTTIIFGMLRPESRKYYDGSVNILHRVDPDEQINKICAYWRYSPYSVGIWKDYGKPKSYTSFVLCKFSRIGNYALISPDDDSVTNDLLDILGSNDSVPETMDKLVHISEKYDKFKPMDVSVVAQILGKIDEEDVDLLDLSKVVSNLQEINPIVLSRSQVEGEATDAILSKVDHIAEKHDASGIVWDTDNFLIISIDLKENFSGLALLLQGDVFIPQILEGNMSINDVIENDSFHSAVVLSDQLINQIHQDSKIIITIFSKDVLFNEKKSHRHKFVSKIYGVILPEIGEYEGPVSVFYKVDKIRHREECAHWNYDKSHNIPGFWKKDGKSKGSSKFLQCDFWHTTHFAYLISDRMRNESPHCFDFLAWTTLVNCSISALSLACIILTAFLFRCWRENTGNQILLNFTFVIILQITVFYVSHFVDKFSTDLCTIVGIFLHYSIISQFCWMLVIAILQFRRFVIVLEGPPKFVLLKACVCGWFLPLLPVACVVTIDRGSYVNSNVGLCYPSGLGLYLGVWLPVIMIISINFIIFSITFYSIINKKANSVDGGSTSSTNGDVVYHWRLAILLFFMLGFTWTFGFLAQLEFGLVFEYVFCMTATLQGFILFLFFILFNASTRNLYLNAISKFCKNKFK